VELFKDGDWVEAFRSLVHLLLVPLNVDVYNERSRNISPDLEEVALEKHLIAGPLAFAVLEGILRRKNSHYVNNDGIVHTPFTVVQPTGKRHSQAKGLLNRINISLRLFEQVVTENRGRPCSALKLMSDEIAGLYPGSIDAYDLVDLWRNDLVHGNQYWQNRVPIILNIICLLIIDDVEPDLYRDNSKEVRQLHDWLRTTRPDLSAFDN